MWREMTASVLLAQLWRGDLGTELPHLAVLRPSTPDPKQKSRTDRYQKGDLRRHSGFLAAETESLSAEIQNVPISSL
ncbi:hypothetical protein YTPLAS72_34200 [Nitrospira sp.]|nr:hypothetical protein YTPLAS72_34200 [Nitrospira sp.]